MVANEQTLLFTQFWKGSRVMVTDEFLAPPVVLKIDDSIIATLGNFSASTGKAKSKKTFNISAIVAAMLTNSTVLNYQAYLPPNKQMILYVDTEQSPFHCKRVLERIIKLADLPLDKQPENLEFLALRKFSPDVRIKIIEQAIYNTENLGVVIIDGIRDLAFDINSPSEATDVITKLMLWTDECYIHIHTVLHLNKGDDNTRGHLGTELNNKAEAILQVTKNEVDNDVSIVTAKCIRDVEFEPFAFRINDESLPELLFDFCITNNLSKKAFDYNDLAENKHMSALNLVFSDGKQYGYSELIVQLKKAYQEIVGVEFGVGKAKQLKQYLENKQLIIQEGKKYKYNSKSHI